MKNLLRFILSICPIFIIGCNRTENTKVEQESSDLQKVSDQITAVIATKCSDGYHLTGGQIIPESATDAAKTMMEFPKESKNALEGITWSGQYSLGEAYQIFRRNGQWFLKDPQNGPVKLEDLANIAPMCPK